MVTNTSSRRDSAACCTSSTLLQRITPLALFFFVRPFPLPPACICALTTNSEVPSACSSSAALTAPSTVVVEIPLGTGTPKEAKISLA